MIADNINVTGKLQIFVIDKNGNIKQEVNVPNMVVNVGKAFIVGRMNTSPPTAMSHMAIGGNGTATTPTMTGLLSETLSAGDTGTKIRSAFSSVLVNSETSSITYSANFPAGLPSVAFTVKEAGIFNSASSGTMLARTAFGAVAKGVDDSIVINWTITLN